MASNKAKLYINLQQWLDAGQGTADLIVDAPYQNPEYSPYVVAAMLKKTPIKQIPFFVLEKLGEELIASNEPKKAKKWQFWRK